MMCQICGKKPAIFHYTEIIENKITKLSICPDCAKKKGLYGTPEKTVFSLGNLLSGLVEEDDDIVTEKGEGLICPRCGTRYDEFREVGRLGCEQCYITFDKQMTRLLRRIHGSNRHEGQTSAKKDKGISAAMRVEELKKEMQLAVEEEAFEKAAELRDQIRELERKPVKKAARKENSRKEEN